MQTVSDGRTVASKHRLALDAERLVHVRLEFCRCRGPNGLELTPSLTGDGYCAVADGDTSEVKRRTADLHEHFVGADFKLGLSCVVRSVWRDASDIGWGTCSVEMKLKLGILALGAGHFRA